MTMRPKSWLCVLSVAAGLAIAPCGLRAADAAQPSGQTPPPAAAGPTFTPLLEQGKDLLEKGDLAAAAARFRQAIAADPAHHAGHFQLAEVLHAQGDFAAAEEHAKLALAKAPDGTIKWGIEDLLAVLRIKREFVELMGQGKALLEGKRHAEALARFRRAEDLAGGDMGPFQELLIEAQFFAAVAAYRDDDLDTAEKYARFALNNATESARFDFGADAARRFQEAREKAGQMLAVIEDRKYERAEAAAEEAYQAGLLAKAAEAYHNAYLTSPAHGRAGLRAAEIYADSLNRLFDAALLWQKIAASREDPASIETARAELARHERDLAGLFATRHGEAQKAGQPATYEQLIAAFPDKLEPRVELAALYLGCEDYPRAIAQLAAANKLGLTAREILARPLTFGAALTHAPFRRFIADAYGPDTVKTMETEFERLHAEQRARELARELRITVAEPDAEIWINGQFEGRKEVILKNRPAGDYKMELRLKGYKTYKTSVSHRPDPTNPHVMHRFSFKELSAKTLRCTRCGGNGTVVTSNRCYTCKGEATRQCGWCEGKGRRTEYELGRARVLRCENCQGRGRVPCPDPNCTNGIQRITTTCDGCGGGGKVSSLDLVPPS